MALLMRQLDCPFISKCIPASIVLTYLKRLDAALVRFSRIFGTSIQHTITRHVVLLVSFIGIYTLALLANSQIAWILLWLGYVGVISVGRAWVSNEKLRTAIARKLSDADPDEMPDLRLSAFLSALQLLVIIPLLLKSSHELFDLYIVPIDASYTDWFLLGIDLLCKSLLDWSEIYGVQFSSINLDSMGGRHLIMLLLLTIDFILIQGILRYFEIRRTVGEGVSAAVRDPEMAYRLGRRAVPSLLEQLNNDDLTTVERTHVIEALAVLRESEACESLIQLFEHDELNSTAVAAMVSIGLVPPLIEALNGTSRLIQRGAVTALGRIGDPDAIPALSDAMKRSEPKQRERIVRAFARIEGDASLHLIQALSDDDTGVRLAALQGLVLNSSEELMLKLIEMMGDSVAEIRLGVADALQRFGDGRVVTPLVAALEDSDPRVARQAQRSLDHLQSVVDRKGISSDQ
jgi:hypothetical protein